MLVRIYNEDKVVADLMVKDAGEAAFQVLKYKGTGYKEYKICTVVNAVTGFIERLQEKINTDEDIPDTYIDFYEYGNPPTGGRWSTMLEAWVPLADLETYQLIDEHYIWVREIQISAEEETEFTIDTTAPTTEYAKWVTDEWIEAFVYQVIDEDDLWVEQVIITDDEATALTIKTAAPTFTPAEWSGTEWVVPE